VVVASALAGAAALTGGRMLSRKGVSAVGGNKLVGAVAAAAVAYAAYRAWDGAPAASPQQREAPPAHVQSSANRAADGEDGGDQQQNASPSVLSALGGAPWQRTADMLGRVLGRLATRLVTQGETLQKVSRMVEKENVIGSQVAITGINLDSFAAQQRQLAAEAHYATVRELLKSAMEAADA